MDLYDVVVVGAGPCGSSAAKVAAEKGARTILLEEHPQIGIPQHCQGRLSGTTSGSLERLTETLNPRVVISEIKARRLYTPSGKMIEIPLSGTGAKIVDRSLFDLELARQAANAGAEVMVNTRVISLIHEDGFIKGVNTISKDKPQVYGKVVIAADGIHALAKGIIRSEGMVKGDIHMIPQVAFFVTEVEGLELGVMETHYSQMLDSSAMKRNWAFLCPQDNVSCLVDFPSLEDFKTVKAGSLVISKKLRNCRVLRVTGVSMAQRSGDPLPKKVKGGLIVAGHGAGLHGIDSAVFSGQFAGQVAAEVAETGDPTEKKLSKYEELCKKLEYGRGNYMHNISGLSDEELEKAVMKEAERDKFGSDDVLPI